MRRSNYRLVLPEGPLRRFRLPESFGDEVRPTAEGRPLPVFAGLGWLGVCFCSWALAAGAVDPTRLLDRTWQLNADQAGDSMLAGVLADANRGTNAPSVTPARPAALAPRLAPPSPAPAAMPRSELPKVVFPDVQVHRGGFGLVGPAPSEGSAAASEVTGATPRFAAAPEERVTAAASPRAGAEPARSELGDMVRDLVAGASHGLPRPRAPQPDPFEADFATSSLPRLSEPTIDEAPVALRPSAAPGADDSSRAPLDQTPTDATERPSGEHASVSWNGGCQRAFDASVQHIGDGPTQPDASGADYTRALQRLNVAACAPRAGTRVDMCVTVNQGRVIGATVTTTPSTPALAECLLRKVRALKLPVGGGTDLVRTHYQVD